MYICIEVYIRNCSYLQDDMTDKGTMTRWGFIYDDEEQSSYSVRSSWNSNRLQKQQPKTWTGFPVIVMYFLKVNYLTLLEKMKEVAIEKNICYSSTKHEIFEIVRTIKPSKNCTDETWNVNSINQYLQEKMQLN